MKRISSFLALLLTVSPILADDFGFRFGLKASPNIAWFRTETRSYDNRGVKIGYSYGLIIDYEFAENYSITSGLNFLQTGGKMNYDWIHHANENNDQENNNDGFLTRKQRSFHYRHIEIPLALKLRTTEIGYMTYYGKFGLGLGFRTSARADDRVTLPNDQYLTENNIDISEETKFLRAGLVLGGGLEYSFGGSTALLVGLTLHNGFSNILDGRNPAVDHAPSSHNLYLELTLGVMF